MRRDWAEDELEQLRTLYCEDDIPLAVVSKDVVRGETADGWFAAEC
jgi:hypothetical protein